MSGREHDLVLYGASGFVGRLVAEQLAEQAPAGLRVALGGRSRQRLERVRAGLPGEAPAGPSWSPTAATRRRSRPWPPAPGWSRRPSAPTCGTGCPWRWPARGPAPTTRTSPARSSTSGSSSTSARTSPSAPAPGSSPPAATTPSPPTSVSCCSTSKPAPTARAHCSTRRCRPAPGAASAAAPSTPSAPSSRRWPSTRVCAGSCPTPTPWLRTRRPSRGRAGSATSARCSPTRRPGSGRARSSWRPSTPGSCGAATRCWATPTAAASATGRSAPTAPDRAASSEPPR